MPDLANKYKLDLINLKLNALSKPDEIGQLLIETLDNKSLLYISQRSAIEKIVSMFSDLETQILDLKQVNENLSLNNAVLAGIQKAEDTETVLSDYDRIMNMEE
jgi:molybdopterin converting factor small subunit